MKTWRVAAPLITVLLALMPALAQAQTVTAMWDASPPADQVTGYQVCVGTSSLSCNVALASVGASQTSYTFTPRAGTLHYVAIRALNASGAGSYSSEVSFSIPAITQPANQSSPVGVAISGLNLTVSDPDGGSLHFTHTGLPPGLTLNSTTGQVTGTPSAAGTYNATVFVGDGLVTVSRSWVWTVTSSSSDTQAPNLAITSHTGGQTLTVAGITFGGTATDSNRGGSGVTSVKVNGVAATGGTATASNTANWSRAITLSSGANTITVEATDGAGNVNMQQLTLNFSGTIAPVTGATLTPNVASPEDAGTAITFTAAGSGGVAPRQYKFLVAQGGGAAQTVRSWSTTATYAWTPTTAASYTVSVWVRSAGVTVDAPQASAQVPYSITTASIAPVTAATITSNLASPRNTGTAITFTAAGSGGVAPRQYKFLVAQGGGAAQTTQNWSTTATYTWTPTTAANYTVSVWVRSAGATADVAQASAQMAYAVTAPVGTVAAVSATPSTGSGLTQTFALQYADTVSASNLATTWVWFNASFGSDSSRSCMIYYDRAASRIYMLNDASSVWRPGILGTTDVLQNSQCALSLAGSSVSLSGTTLTLNLAMTFSSGYAGAKHIYLYGANRAGLDSGWQDRGDWTVAATASAPPPPTVTSGGSVTAVSVTPSSGSGSTQTFALQYANSSGASRFKQVWVWFNPNFGSSSANSCMLYYDLPSGKLNQLNDAGSTWISGSLGAGGSLQNSQCRVGLAGSSVSLSGTTLTLNLAMTFNSSYAGTKNVYLFGLNAADVNSGWQDRGDWTVPTSSGTPSLVPQGVSAISASPSIGSGAAWNFSFQYGDSTGASNLATTWVWFNGSFGNDSSHSCMLYYDRAASRIYMLDDAGSVWRSGVLGTSGVLQNSQCALSLASSSVSISGTSLTLNLAMSFKPIYSGSKNIYMYAENKKKVNSGWQQRGSWIVP